MQETKVLQRTQEVFRMAEKLYDVDLSGVIIQFSLLGSAAGQAGAIGTLDEGYLYYVRFNRDMLFRRAFDHLYDETIPHEAAHLVCFKIPTLGRGHNTGWVKVCKSLGGTGAVLHNEDIIYRNGVTYEYTTTAGRTVRVSQRVHSLVRNGHTYSFQPGMGFIDSSCKHSIVGVSGKTTAKHTFETAQTEMPLLLAA